MAEMDPITKARYETAQARIEQAREQQAKGRGATRINQLFAVLPEPAYLLDGPAAEEREAQARAQTERELRSARAKKLEALRVPLAAHDERLLLDGALRTDLGKSLPDLRAWYANPNAKPWAVVGGPPGRGKTVAGVSLLLESGGRYVSAREAERLSMATFGDEAEAFRVLCDRKGLLVLDDLGRESSAERMTSALLDLVDYRRGSGKRTVLIANLSDEKMRDRYPDPRLWSRLDESAEWITDKGPDLRAVKP